MNYSPNINRTPPVQANNWLAEKRQRLPVFAPAPVPASADDASAAQDDPPETFLMAAQRHGKQLLAGWATSLLLHFILLAVLALVTLAGSSADLGLELAFSDSVDSVEFQEVQFELPALDDAASSESLESLVPEDHADESALELSEVAVDAAIEMESLLADSLLESESLGLEVDQPMSEGDSSGAGGGGTDSQDSGANFYGIESEGNRFVFVIDASTSMLDGGRWGRAVEELLESISQLKSSQKFLVLTYSSSFRPMMNMPMDKIDLVRATRGNKRRLTNWLYNQRPNGVTMPAGAMMVGLSLNVDAIYLLSDGLLMDRTDFMLRQHNQPRLLRYGGGRKTPVHTIAMDVAGEGAELLQVIAEENSGVFRVVK